MKQFQLLTDDELITGFMAGKGECADILIDRHRNKVFTYILMNVKQRDLAEDIFQETFFKVLQSLQKGQYSENGRFSSWMLRIAHNLIIDHYRRKKNMGIVSSDENDHAIANSLKHSERSVEDQIAYDQILKDIAALVHLLPPLQQEVVRMRHYQGLSFKEIAEETHVSINTALGRMRYAVMNLRRLIEEKNLSVSI
jgi:RNA polymerase sigma-70 factor (ECF subfamily)